LVRTALKWSCSVDGASEASRNHSIQRVTSIVSFCVRSRWSNRRTLLPNLCRHAVEALGTVFRAPNTISAIARSNSAVAIVERVDGHEPEMSQPGFQDRIHAAFALNQSRNVSSPRRVALPPAPEWTSPATARKTTPSALLPFAQVPTLILTSRYVRSEKERVPRKEPFDRKRRSIVTRGVEHHFNDARRGGPLA